MCWLQAPATAKDIDSSIVGILEFHRLESKIFNNTRTIRVLLPKEYCKKPKKSYPVLYMNDGQNLFDAKTSNSNPMEWGVDETMEKLIESKKIEPIIIVGIDNAGRKMRPYEYLPWNDIYLKPPCPNPQGKKYPDFLVNEVIPFINKLYRTQKGPGNTGLGGTSYGGLITLYTALKKPGVFDYLLIESPSFYVCDKAVLREAKTFSQWPRKIYLGVGAFFAWPLFFHSIVIVKPLPNL
jgi:predicted alpha/beta superfamily hydrolase